MARKLVRAFLVGLAALGWSGIGAWGQQTMGNIYLGLRNLALSQSGQRQSSTGLIGMIFEVGMSDGSITLALMQDGSVSVYKSTGGVTIGANGHVSIRRSAEHLLAEAKAYVEGADLTNVYPLPADGASQFYLLTANGVRKIAADSDDMVEQHPAKELFFEAMDLMVKVLQLND